jgi:fumarate reductase subunit C
MHTKTVQKYMLKHDWIKSNWCDNNPAYKNVNLALSRLMCFIFFLLTITLGTFAFITIDNFASQKNTVIIFAVAQTTLIALSILYYRTSEWFEFKQDVKRFTWLFRRGIENPPTRGMSSGSLIPTLALINYIIKQELKARRLAITTGTFRCGQKRRLEHILKEAEALARRFGFNA